MEREQEMDDSTVMHDDHGTDDYVEVVDPVRAKEIMELARHPLVDALVVIEIVHKTVSSGSQRPVVETDSFVVDCQPGKYTPGTMIVSQFWQSGIARQLSHLAEGQVIVARVLGKWMPEYNNVRLSLDPGVDPEDYARALATWEAYCESVTSIVDQA